MHAHVQSNTNTPTLSLSLTHIQTRERERETVRERERRLEQEMRLCRGSVCPIWSLSIRWEGGTSPPLSWRSRGRTVQTLIKRQCPLSEFNSVWRTVSWPWVSVQRHSVPRERMMAEMTNWPAWLDFKARRLAPGGAVCQNSDHCLTCVCVCSCLRACKCMYTKILAWVLLEPEFCWICRFPFDLILWHMRQMRKLEGNVIS